MESVLKKNLHQGRTLFPPTWKTLLETIGIEPMTSCVQSMRSTN